MHLITTRNAAFLAVAALAAVGNAGRANAQDYTLGANARTFAMGGAGIALTHLNGTSGRANPASLAYERNNVLPTFPSIAMRSDGPTSSNAGSSYLLNGTREGDSISLAGQFGSAASDAAINGYAALRFGKFEVSSNAVGIVHVRPNAEWENWVANGHNLINNLAVTAKTDVYAGGYYTMPGVAFANTLPNGLVGKKDTLAIGLRFKEVVGLYSHRIVQSGLDSSGNRSQIYGTPAPEMGGASQLKANGFGADFGLLIRPRNTTGLSFGLVAGNFVKPKISFQSTDAVTGNTSRFDLIQSTISGGLAYESPFGLALVGDLVNIGSGRDLEGNATQDLRLGAEQKLFHTVSLRGGYSQLNGTTYGLGFFGLDIAFGSKVPLEVVRTLNF
jgi:hypothetical protein